MKTILVPDILNIVGFENGGIKFSADAIKFIIKNYTYEAGVRKLKERVLEIIRQINLEYITNSVCDECDTILKPRLVDIPFIKEFFKDKPKIQSKKINKEAIGLVKGLFATASGMGRYNS